jgi:hypothetical protein
MAYQKASSLHSPPVSVYSSDDVEGEEKELRSALETMKEKGEKLKKKLAEEGVQWHCSPPHAPLLGGT